MNNQNKLSIVIPSFNGQKLLEKNLPVVIKFFPNSELIVVDDCSKDKTRHFLESRYPNIKLFCNSQNKGFAFSSNRGVLESSYNLVLLLNNDCQPVSDFRKYIFPYFKDTSVFSVGCLEKLNKDKRRGRGVGGFNKGLFFHQAGKFDKNNTLWNFGASTIYNKQIFKKLGGFDIDFSPFYWEDFDLSYRALKSGYKIYFEKKAIVLHQESTTIKKYYKTYFVNKISYRNQLLVVWKNLTDKDFLLRHLLWLPFHILITSIKSQGAFLLGFFMALIRLPRVLKKRRINQFVYTDKKILNEFQSEIK